MPILPARHRLTRFAAPLALAAALALGGCVEPLSVSIATLNCVRLGVAPPSDTTVLLGQVRAPRHLITGGTPDGAPLAELPVPGAEVALVDATGVALPGLPRATTDAEGRYRLSGVPARITYVVRARFMLKDGQPATLKTLTQATLGEVHADVTLATGLVAADLVQVLNGFSTNLRSERFDEAVAKTQKLLTNDRVPNLADEGDVLGLAATLLNVSPDLRGTVSQLKQDLATSAAAPLVE